MSESIKLIVGLGNPGPEYAQTRHNAGAWFVQSLAQQQQSKLQTESKFRAQIAHIVIDNMDCWLLIPNTFMNLSGQSVQSFCQFYKIQPSQILIAHDELDFAPGTVRLKQSGGHGGHNGLRDIIARIGADFFRLRIGIGHPGHRDKVHDYVLSRPNKIDYELIQNSIIQALAVLPDMIKGDTQKAMRSLHTV